ncbi:ABC transporter ATP-binding protein [Martelella mangrovi]|uniref:Multiple sugar transport system ATP-binding protein n=1 Tax=Martelella mangrovi TaxID=1397477 RepID=A0ABV2IH48_9HYPH
MPALTFRNVSKTFGDNTVIKTFDAEIHDGEFLVLLGPSGCGKSTLLRMIAGLSDISSGDLLFNGEVANDWQPKKRGVAFVFQTYALYPHATVRENIAFPLIMDAFRKWYHLPVVNMIARARLMKRADIAERTLKIARQLELEPLLDRRPASLSGGQRQRVALARALVRNPSLYLLDEPLSNLDAKLRTQMRSEISALHHKVGKTFVYVTHDQVEAMTMASRIIIMNKGVVQQVGTPDEIYDQPANTFVAQFVGSPPMNLIPASIRDDTLKLSGKLVADLPAPLPKRREVTFGIRPEKLSLLGPGEGRLPAPVSVVERLGAETVIGCRLMTGDEEDDGRLLETGLVFVRVSGHLRMEIGQSCSLDYDADDVLLFDVENGQRLK